MNAPAPPPSAQPANILARQARGGRYTRLFDVRIQHSYYNGDNGACPDLAVSPTPDCARLMRTLGMVFKDRGAGFTVLVDQASAPAAARYIAARLQAGAPGLTWLSFLLTPTNAGFIGITQLPITLNPTVQNLHASNLDVASGGVLALDGATAATTGAGAQTKATSPTLYPVKGASITAPTPDGATAVLTDFAGAAVACPVSHAGATTTFRLIGAPYGLYTVTTTPTSGEASSSSFIYAPSPPPTLCVLDLVLAQAPGASGDASAFPFVASVGTPPSSGAPPSGAPAPSGGGSGVTLSGPTAVELVLPFAARQTYWQYYVVAQARAGGRGGGFGPDLQITGAGATFTSSAETLPNGDQAVLFTADTPLTLQQRSTHAFALGGQRQGANGASDAISIARLPTAPPVPVWPGPTGDVTSGVSEIYVYV